MRAQIRGMNQASRNAQDGISLIQTAEGYMQTITEMGQRIRELTVQAANDTYTSSENEGGVWTTSNRDTIRNEIQQLGEEINRIWRTATFNGQNLFDDGDQVLTRGRGGVTPSLPGMGDIAEAVTPAFVGTTALWTTDEIAFTATQIDDDALASLVDATGASEAQLRTAINAMVNSALDTAFNAGALTGFGSWVYDLLGEDGTEPGYGVQTSVAAFLGSTAGDSTAGELTAENRATVVSALHGIITNAIETGDLGDYLVPVAEAGTLEADILAAITVPGTMNLNEFTDFVTALRTGVGHADFDAEETTATELRALMGVTTDLQAQDLGFATVAAMETELDLILAEDEIIEALAAPPPGGGGPILADTFNLQVGANRADGMGVNVHEDVARVHASITSGTGHLNRLHNSDFNSPAQINPLIENIDHFLSDVNGLRAALGAYQNRLEFTIENLDIASENLSASESRIRDADMAAEMMRLTQANVLQQAATAMLAQANQAPQSILQLLG
jgi:flagellin